MGLQRSVGDSPWRPSMRQFPLDCMCPLSFLSLSSSTEVSYPWPTPGHVYGDHEVSNRQNPLSASSMRSNGELSNMFGIGSAAGTAEKIPKLVSGRLRGPTPDFRSMFTPIG